MTSGASVPAAIFATSSIRPRIVGAIDQLHNRYSRLVVEQAAIAGAFNVELVTSKAGADATADLIAARLNQVAEEMEKGWTGIYGNDGFILKREIRGVTESHSLEPSAPGPHSSLDARA